MTQKMKHDINWSLKWETVSGIVKENGTYMYMDAYCCNLVPVIFTFRPEINLDLLEIAGNLNYGDIDLMFEEYAKYSCIA